MKKLKNIIILISILIVIVFVVLLTLKFMDKKREKDIDLEGDPGEELVITNEIEDVTTIGDFYTVKQCVQAYYGILNNNSSSYYTQDEDGNKIALFEETEINQFKLDLLSEEYIEENNISINNIEQFVDTIEDNVAITVFQMKQIVNDPVTKYLTYGLITNLDNQIIKDFYLCVNLDVENMTFSIEPITKKYNSIEEITFENTNKNIEENNINVYDRIEPDYEEIAKEYFSTYNQIILAAPRFLYNNYMDEEYKVKRFGSSNEFESYVEKNKEEILNAKIKRYLVNHYEDYSEYVCMDQYQRVYVFKETIPMNFTLTLDTYTITSEEFITEYEKAETQKKVAMNINKWIQMLNNRDYKTAYQVLDESYRNNTFGSEEEFEKQMKGRLPAHYKIEYEKNSEERGTYIQNISLVDIAEENNSEKVNMTVIMQLKEDTEFVMSFSFQ